MIEILSRDPQHPWKCIPDSVERILKDMEAYTLDPVFERFGDFVDRRPEWLGKAEAEKYAGCAMIFGNFLEYSGAFRVVTDDRRLIARVARAVAKNKARPEYIAARERIRADCAII